MPALRPRIAAVFVAAIGALAACMAEETTQNSDALLDEAWLAEWWTENTQHMTTIRIDMEASELAWWEIHELTEDVMDTLFERRFWLQTRVFGFQAVQYSWEFLLAGDCSRAKAHLTHILSLPESADRIRRVVDEADAECLPGPYFLEPNVIDLSKVRNRSRKEQP
ncbi:MAG: hypothetical protein ACK4MQ_06950 [Hyphomonas sp.]